MRGMTVRKKMWRDHLLILALESSAEHLQRLVHVDSILPTARLCIKGTVNKRMKTSSEFKIASLFSLRTTELEI